MFLPLLPISLPFHFVQCSVCGLSFEGYRNLISLPPGVCTLVDEVGPKVCALILLIWALIAVNCDQSLLWIFRAVSPLFCGCYCPLSGGVCSLHGGIEPPDVNLSCDSDLWWEVGGSGAPPLGEKSVSITPLGLCTQAVLWFPLSCVLQALM